MNSVVAFACGLYSAYVLDHENVACFGAFHDTKFGPTKIEKPPVQPIINASSPIYIRKDN
jgi:hypothetical protein